MNTIPNIELGLLETCDVCGSQDFHPAGSYVMQVSDHALSGSQWHLCRCEQCGLVFVNPRPKAQLFGGFVPDARKDVAEKKMWSRRLRCIERLHRPGNLLDVGPGAGALLHYARGRGWNVLGLEIQDDFARNLRRQGLKIQVGELSDPSIQQQRFDVVTLWDVIEHVPSVQATLECARNVVRPGGILAISTINAGSFNARLVGARWIFWNRPGKVPEHLQAFMPRTLQLALRAAGFEPVRIRTRFAAGAIIEPLSTMVALDRHLGARWTHFRRSVVGRIAAYVLWRIIELAGRPLDMLLLGDLIEVYGIRQDSVESVVEGFAPTSIQQQPACNSSL
jgi:SAM-dependent methyltransferase